MKGRRRNRRRSDRATPAPGGAADRRAVEDGRSTVLRRAVVAAVTGGAFLVAGCVAPSPEVTDGDPVLFEGRRVYGRHCANCHGSAGQGGRGTRLNGGAVLEAFPDPADHATLIRDGRNQMPSFRQKLTDDQIDAVVRYSREVLNQPG